MFCFGGFQSDTEYRTPLRANDVDGSGEAIPDDLFHNYCVSSWSTKMSYRQPTAIRPYSILMNEGPDQMASRTRCIGNPLQDWPRPAKIVIIVDPTNNRRSISDLLSCLLESPRPRHSHPHRRSTDTKEPTDVENSGREEE